MRESLGKVRLCHLPILAFTRLYLKNHMSTLFTGYVKGRAVLDTLGLWQSALLILESIEVTKLWYFQCSQHVRTVNRYFCFVTRPCSFKQVTICNQMQTSSMQDNDKFPSSSIVNCCTDVIFQLASFSSLFLYKCLKIWLF